MGVFEAFTASLHAPNWLAWVFPGPGIAVLLLGLMIGPLTVATFVFDGLEFSATLRSTVFRLKRPPVLSFLATYVFVLVPAYGIAGRSHRTGPGDA